MISLIAAENNSIFFKNHFSLKTNFKNMYSSFLNMFIRIEYNPLNQRILLIISKEVSFTVTDSVLIENHYQTDLDRAVTGFGLLTTRQVVNKGL